MMGFEWYSGSDSSNRVPVALDEYLTRSDRWSVAERIEFLKGVLCDEHDPNWCGHIHYLIGAEFLAERDYSNAIQSFLVAESNFDCEAQNFQDVSASFCRARLGLIREKLTDEEDDELIFEFGLSVLCWKNEATFSPYEEMTLLNSLGFAIAGLAHRWESSFFDRLALQVRLRAHSSAPQDLGQLENLFLSFLSLKDKEGCRRTIEKASNLESGNHLVYEMENLLSASDLNVD